MENLDTKPMNEIQLTLTVDEINKILESLGIDYIDESEVLTPADDEHHINKHKFKMPFVCGCRNLGEALRRIAEGAAMMRTKGEAGTGDVVEAVRHARAVNSEIPQGYIFSTSRLVEFLFIFRHFLLSKI